MRLLALTIICLVSWSSIWAKPMKKEQIPASERVVRFDKKIDPGTLQAQLVSAGFAVNYIDCSNIHCTIHIPPTEKKDPMPIVSKYVYVDPFLARKKKQDEMKMLYNKWEAGIITAQEKDQLLKLMVGMMLGR